MIDLLNAIVSGLALAMPLFLAASGLTLIYGVMHVLNFAHGSFFMIGAYTAVVVMRGQVHGLGVFILGAIVAGLVVAAISVVSEILIFRWLDPKEHLLSLLGSYALSLVIAGAVIELFGPAAKTQPQTPMLSGSWTIGRVIIGRNDVFLIGVGLFLAILLWSLLNKTSFGNKAVAVAADHVMAEGLGIRVRVIAMGIFAVGGFLAGIAGGFASPMYSIGPGLDQMFVLQSFAVVIIGGLGSIGGAFAASIMLGLVEAIVAQYAPSLSGYVFYVTMGLVLMLRPQGLAIHWRRHRPASTAVHTSPREGATT